MKLRASNPPVEGLEKSFLSSSYSAGATSIVIRNNDRFAASQKILVGEMGHERSEIVTINTVTTPGTNFTLTGSGLIFPHDADTPVYVLKYDKVRFYRSTTGIDGSYSQLAEVVMDVDNETKDTVYDDVAGLSSYYYKVAFFSTADGSETELSDPIPGAGYPDGTAGSLVNEFFVEISDPNQQQMTVSEVIGLLNEVNKDIISQSRRPYRFLKRNTTLSITGGSNRIALPADLVKFDRLLYTTKDGYRTDAYRRISMEEMEYYFFDNTNVPTDDLLYVAIDDSENEIVLGPTPVTSQVGAIKLYYYKKFNLISSLADEFETPNDRIYKLFLFARYYRKRSVKEPSYIGISDRYTQDYNSEIVKLQRMNRIDVGTPQSFKPPTSSSRGIRRF